MESKKVFFVGHLEKETPNSETIIFLVPFVHLWGLYPGIKAKNLKCKSKFCPFNRLEAEGMAFLIPPTFLVNMFLNLAFKLNKNIMGFEG